MTKYEIIPYWSTEDYAFIAEAPELPGCAAEGQTRPIPEPKGRLLFA
jgi:predicted RNase H-like HicB family nuclease